MAPGRTVNDQLQKGVSMSLPKEVNVRPVPFIVVALFSLILGGCGSSWDPFSPIAGFWEDMTESAADAETTAAAGSGAEQAGPEEPASPEEPAGGGDGAATEVSTGEPSQPEPEEGEEEPADGNAVPPDLSGVRWLHTDVSGWSETVSLRSVRVSGGTITLDYDKAKSWPGRDHAGAYVNANPWIFVHRDGTWYAGTWEWLRHGQTSKSVRSVNGDHIKKSPLNSFSPRSGERYGFMVSGLARDRARNVRERTNVVMVTWP